MNPIDVLIDLFGCGPEDLHGAVIVDPAGMAQLVIDALAETGFQIVVGPSAK
jgi:hypothetical protein